MIKNAVVVASIIYFAAALYVLGECEFLQPYRGVLWDRHAAHLGIFSAVLFLNLVVGAYALIRKIAMKDTGEKLAHLDRQLRSSVTVSEELSRRIREEEDDEGSAD